VNALDVARRAGRQRLLNAFLRETGVHDVAAGTLRVPLATAGETLVVEVRHPSIFGHHCYGDGILLEQGDGACRTLDHDAFVDLLLGQLAGRTGTGGTGELAGQVANSIARTTRYLRRGKVVAPCADAQAVTRHAEQSLLLGHPFHPTPKSAEGFDEADLARYAPELGASFALHLFAVAPRLLSERRAAPGRWLPEHLAPDAPSGYALLPTHPWQARYLLALPSVAALIHRGEVADLGPRGPEVYPTSSVRTVCAPGFETAWKLSLHVRITNYVRTNPVEHAHRAIDASALIADLVGRSPYEGFHVLLESGFRTVDPAIVGDALAADLTVLFREHPFASDDRAPRVLAGLLEEGVDGQPPDLIACVREAGDVAGWLRRYLDVSLRPLMTLFARHGVSLEAHVQNSLLCVEAGWPVGLWVRDMEGASVSRQRLARNGTHHALPLDSPALYDDGEAWLRLRYHVVTNQLGHLISVLGRYTEVEERRLWHVVGEALGGWPEAEPYATALLRARGLPAKANLLSRFAGRSEQPRYVEVPNPMRAR